MAKTYTTEGSKFHDPNLKSNPDLKYQIRFLLTLILSLQCPDNVYIDVLNC